MNALTVGKRVRTETYIDRQAVSISSAAVELAKQELGTLNDKTVLSIHHNFLVHAIYGKIYPKFIKIP